MKTKRLLQNLNKKLIIEEIKILVGDVLELALEIAQILPTIFLNHPHLHANDVLPHMK